MREPLDGFEQEALETEAGLALVVLLPEEGNKLRLLLDGLLQNLHCLGEVIDVLAVVLDHLLAVKLGEGQKKWDVGGGRWEEGGEEEVCREGGSRKGVGVSISNHNISGRYPYWRVQLAAQMNTRS